MATPTPMKHALSQQGRTPSQTHGAVATPPVSTPFSTYAHAAFSPLGPRSSPQQVKKSPANSATLMGRGASSGGGGNGVPMTYDSPAAAAMGALSINGGLDIGGLDHVSVSGLGSLAPIGRSDEDERARRLETVVAMLKHSKGHVSEAGLERLAKSMGLECLWEEGMGANKARTLIIAGSALAVEIVLSNNIVESVSVTFPESRSIVLRHVERADQILLADLQLRPDESPLTKTLEGFAANLEQLAALDRLSVEPGLNLYEAVAGVYETLERLFRWDLQKLHEDPAFRGRGEDDLAMLAQCARHGRPTMHEHRHLGLGIDYWQQRRLVRPTHARTRHFADTREKTWSILVSCAPTGGGGVVYQPVRVSDKWLSDAIEKPPDAVAAAAAAAADSILPGEGAGSGSTPPSSSSSAAAAALPMLDWLEPDNTILSSGAAAAAHGASGHEVKTEEASDANGGGHAPTSLADAKLPDVRFNAVFSPPVAVPFSVWHHIYEIVGLVPEAETLVTFDALSFPVEAGSQHDPSEPRTICCDKDVYVQPKGGNGSGSGSGSTGGVIKKHRHTLFIYKPVYGRSMAELPFSHPGQLVRMLPTLRQYAFLATLLESAFDTRMTRIIEEPPPPPSGAGARGLRSRSKNSRTVMTTTIENEFAAFVDGRKNPKTETRKPGEGVTGSDNNSDNSDSDDILLMDVVLTAHPVPRLQVVFPFRAGTADIMLEIGANAQVHVVSQNVLEEGDGAESGNHEVGAGVGAGAGTGADVDVDVGGDDSGQSRGQGRRRLDPQDLGRMLEVCEDLGLWCEWIRSRCA